jgi:nucleoside-diphosphate-sugar epimerase
MRIFLAGGSGVIGIRLVPLFVRAGHTVLATTRSPEKVEDLRDRGSEPVLCDVFDRDLLEETMTTFRPDIVMDQLTDLPDDRSDLPRYGARNARTQNEGTRNLVDAARSAGAAKVITQSIAWELPNEERQRAVRSHEQMVLDAAGLVVRYGQFYGPGTYYPSDPPPSPRIEIGEAARRTLPLLTAPSGIVVVARLDPNWWLPYVRQED